MIGFVRQLAGGRRYRLLLMSILAVALVCAGGASRYDEDLQTPVRLIAVAVLALTFWPLEFQALMKQRGPMLMLFAAYTLLALQLAPLPPQTWAVLPGHSLFAQVAQATGHVTWRPLSLTPDLTLNALLALLPATAAGIAACYLDFRQRLWVTSAVAVFAIASAGLGVLQANAGGDAFHLYRQSSVGSPVGLFANRNHQAAFLACALPFVGALAGIRARDGLDIRKAIGVATGVAIVLLTALVSTGSRMGLVLGTIGVVGAAFCFCASGHRLVPKGWRARGAMTCLAIGMLVVICGAAWRGGAITRLAATDTVSETRVEMIAPLLLTGRAFMPTGAGFGSFNTVYRQFEPTSLLSTIYMNEAHDEVLQLAIEGGVPALILMALFLIWWMRTGTRLLISIPRGRRRTLALAAMMATLLLMVSSLVDYPLRTPFLGALFVVCCIEMGRGASVKQESGADA